MNRYFIPVRLKSFRQCHRRFTFQINVKNCIAAITVKMAMLPHIRAKTGGTSIKRNLTQKTAPHQNTQAVVNGGKRDFGHAPFHAIEDLIGRRMVVTIRDHLENFAPLACKTKARRLERVLQPFTKLDRFGRGNRGQTVTFGARTVNN